jgi:hypothetical protein
VVRCQLLVPEFTREMGTHYALMMDRRNAELHTGALAFDSLDNAAWLPPTYEVMEVLLKHLNTDFTDFLGKEHAPTALGMLRDRKASIRKETLDAIAQAKRDFDKIPPEEKVRIESVAAGTVKRWLAESQVRQKKSCPACGHDAVIAGDIVGRGPPRIDEANVTIERELRVLPTKLRCPYCDLILAGFQALNAAGRGAIYKVMETEDPVEFFGIDPSDYIDVEQFAKEHFGPEYDNE